MDLPPCIVEEETGEVRQSMCSVRQVGGTILSHLKQHVNCYAPKNNWFFEPIIHPGQGLHQVFAYTSL